LKRTGAHPEENQENMALQEAKSRIRELVGMTVAEGPQLVNQRGTDDPK
jgi:hypothetical protein